MVACAAALSLSACERWACDLHSHGACVEFPTPPPDLAAAQRRMDRLLDLELPYWGLSSLSGWRIQYRDSADYPCYMVDKNDGCTDYLKQTMSIRLPPDDLACFEAGELLHELGHYTLGDPMHSSDWWDGVEAQFAPVVWNRPDAPPECVARYRGIVAGAWVVHRNAF
jgi:hypothetical protein